MTATEEVAVVRAPASPGARLASAFTWLWVSSGGATLADGIYQVALPLAALRIGGGAIGVSAVYTAARLPWALFALHAGVLADRFDRRVLLIGAHTARALMLLAGALIVTLHVGGIPALAAAAFVLGTAETVGDTAMLSITPRVVDRADLERANSRLQATELVTNLFVGPSLGGLLAGIALGWAFGSIALLYTSAALAALRVTLRPAERDPDAVQVQQRDSARRAGRPSVKEGLGFLFARPRLAVYAVGVGSLNLGYSAFQTALPIVVLRAAGLGLSAGQYGLLLGAAGITGLAGGLLAPRLLVRIGRRTGMLLGTCALALGMASAGLTRNLVLVVLGIACTGLLVLVNIITVSYRQRAVPDELLGRVNAAYRLFAFGGLPLGALLAGILQAHLSARLVLDAAGALAILVGIVMTIATPPKENPA